jgi:hypothetical protein
MRGIRLGVTFMHRCEPQLALFRNMCLSGKVSSFMLLALMMMLMPPLFFFEKFNKRLHVRSTDSD